MINADIKLRFSKSFDCPVEYIEKLPDVTVDISLLLEELKFLKKLEWVKNFMQTKLPVYQQNKWSDYAESMVYTKSVVESLKQHVPFNSVYYRYLHVHTCYNWHTDAMKTCLHIPLITNEGCKFVYEDRVFSMPADGSVYIVNNSIPHTFVNSGTTDRLHITMDIF